MSTKGQKTTLLGGILAAVFASICCIGPIIFGILGVSGLGFLMKFEQYRPIFIGVALLLLGGLVTNSVYRTSVEKA